MNFYQFIKQYRAYIVLAIALIIVFSYTNLGHNTVDEYTQIFNLAGFHLGKISYHNLTQPDYDLHIRSSIQIWWVVFIYDCISIISKVANPFIVSYIINLFDGLLLIFSSMLFCYAVVPQIEDKYHKILVIFSLFCVLNIATGIHFNVDNISGRFLVIAVSLIILSLKDESYSKIVFAAISLSIATACRIQIGFAIMAIFVWYFCYCLKHKQLPHFFLLVILVAVLSLLLIIVPDYYFYGKLVFSPYGYYQYNILEHRLSGAGVMPWYMYVLMVSAFLPFGPIFIIAGVYYIYKNPSNLISIVLLSFFLIHSCIGHKEVRFLIPLLGFMPLVIIFFYQSFELNKSKFKKIVMVLWGINLLSYAYLFCPAQEAIGGWEYIFNHYKKPTVMYCNFHWVMHLLFYKPLNLEVIDLDKDSKISCPRDKNCILAIRNGTKYPTNGYKIVYTFFPAWLTPYVPEKIDKQLFYFNLYEIQSIEK